MPSQRHDPALLAQLLDAARRAAEHGAEYVRSRTDSLAALDWQVKSRADFVSEVDLGAETRIGDTLRALIPDALILGEELTPTSTAHDGVTFIVDPLDGTTNFLHGFPAYAVSIGALVGGELAAAVVHDIPAGATYWATLGGGAWCNDQRLYVSTIADPVRALIGTGFPFKDGEQLAPYLPQFMRVATQTAGIRRAGSAALDLAHVAAGRFEAFWELMLAPWDIAAGILLVREAGGRVTDLRGEDARPTHTPLVASNVLLHEWMLAQLNESPPE